MILFEKPDVANKISENPLKVLSPIVFFFFYFGTKLSFKHKVSEKKFNFTLVFVFDSLSLLVMSLPYYFLVFAGKFRDYFHTTSFEM